MDQKVQLLGEWLKDEHSVTELSQSFNVSRKTVYKWIDRYKRKGFEALNELSRAPLNHSNATPIEIAEQVIALKLAHQRWGPKKVTAYLRNNSPEVRWPATSTVGEILKKEGLVKPKKHRHTTPPYTAPFGACEKPNDLWSMDYKGDFRLGDSRRCYPLTLSDNYTRYLLMCRGLGHPAYAETKPWLEWCFREYGLPNAIRSDNGEPFASVGVGGLSKLSIWFVKLGIIPERIEAGHPEQNGRHERMHRTLKEATASPPKENMYEQQQAFDFFVKEFDEETPHEALNMQTPASLYVPSNRAYPAIIPEVEYGREYTIRQVRTNGCIRWKGGLTYVSEALVGEPIGLKQIDDGGWELKFSFHPLGILNERTGKIVSKSRSKPGKVLPMCPV